MAYSENTFAGRLIASNERSLRVGSLVLLPWPWSETKFISTSGPGTEVCQGCRLTTSPWPACYVGASLRVLIFMGWGALKRQRATHIVKALEDS